MCALFCTIISGEDHMLDCDHIVLIHKPAEKIFCNVLLMAHLIVCGGIRTFKFENL